MMPYRFGKVKNKVQDLIVYQRVQKLRREKSSLNKEYLAPCIHGYPGTGKQQLRIVGRIYKRIGLLSKDILLKFQELTSLRDIKVKQH